MKIGIPREVHEGERRVAATPNTVKKLQDMGFEVAVEAGAGSAASFPDGLYADAGATIEPGARELWGGADLVLKVRPPEDHPDLGIHEVDLLPEGGRLISFLWPGQNEDLVQRLLARKATALAMDKVPRISRAQKMDALSSMANIAGYRAVIEAAGVFGSFFTGQITAAGRVPPAKVLVIGAGVAGLQAIAAAKALGAVVRAFDTRPAVKDQVKSVGGEFLELQFEESGEGGGGYAKVMSKEFIDAEMALFREQALEVDIVVTTALIPGKKAPLLWDRGMVESMKPGSVVVDMAAEQGGNCEVTVPGEIVQHHGVHVIGYTDLASRLSTTASELYSTNLCHLLEEMGGGEFTVDLENEVVRGAIVVHDGEVLWPPPPPPEKPAAEAKPVPAPPAEATPAAPVPEETTPPGGGSWSWIVSLALVGLWLYLRFMGADQEIDKATSQFLQQLTVFVLACFVGWQVVWNVTAALHTPLMSVTNAISGIILLGGMLQISGPPAAPSTLLGLAALLFATINIAGGFLVTQRMLRMFRRD